MSTEPKESEFLAAVETRLGTWRFIWIAFMVCYFLVGVLGVVLSTMAASGLFAETTRQVFALGSATCIAIIGFLRPEARYRNVVRAWRELKAAKEAYLYGDSKRSSLLATLKECERIATADETQSRETLPKAPN